MTDFPALTAVRLTPDARTRFPDLATRVGTVLRTDGWVVVQWRGTNAETRLPTADLEALTGAPA